GYESYKMVAVPDAGFYASDTDYPAEVVQLAGTTSLRGQGIACLNLYPLGYNPARQQLQLRYRIRFKLVFSPTREFSPPPVEPPLGLPPPIPQLKIAITQAGIYRLGYDDIYNAGFQDINWLDPHELKLYYHGQEIPMRVMGETDAQFDQADYIEFYAVGNPSKYSATSIYWLTYSDGQGLRIEEHTSISGTAVITPTSFSTTVHLEENDYYRRIRTGDETADRWLWRNPSSGINGDSQVDYDYEIYLPDLSPLASPVSVTLRAAYY
ncbi:unnamed protein product, partial [marine sediment metagenome]